jgi:fused signal recognition particle receptor
MEEMKKIKRVISRSDPQAPHEVFLVLDATTGQNGLAQAKYFTEAVDVTGIILTKLDGTAKGGIVLAICDQLKIPILYIGTGEGIDDIASFDAKAFVEELSS